MGKELPPLERPTPMVVKEPDGEPVFSLIEDQARLATDHSSIVLSLGDGAVSAFGKDGQMTSPATCIPGAAIFNCYPLMRAEGSRTARARHRRTSALSS
ncbi:hypothetical protein LY632_10140 [Erythrobacter sp. SDW2]|uniref:hypothetical protein n=1 Tax=Erythrobacter sp. SDW2 TaxID=2907154 RepID=UPI001F1A854D|nr:hypothetical protein [Erythrobacter sp. SDW2]UIP06058.1 hypothetical protein LY632_10140 [Erythrobacter sp. SDW2]